MSGAALSDLDICREDHHCMHSTRDDGEICCRCDVNQPCKYAQEQSAAVRAAWDAEDQS